MVIRLRYLTVFAVLGAAGLVFATEDPVAQSITAGFSSQKLDDVLTHLSTMSKTPIELVGDQSVLDNRVTLSFENQSLREALDKALADQSYVLVDRGDNGIRILLIGSGGEASRIFAPKAIGGMQGWERQMTYAEMMEAAGHQHRALSAEEIEVVPPERQGERGITLAELQRLEAQRQALSPAEIEVVPPTEQGARGVTLLELEDLLSRADTLSTEAVEVAPPAPGQERGVTDAELIVLEENYRPPSSEILRENAIPVNP